LIGKVEQMGGVVPAIEQGFMQNEIADSAYKYQQAVEAKQRIVVGVNKYAEGIERSRDQEMEGKLLKVDSELGKKRAEELARFRQGRDGARLNTAMSDLHETARGTANLMKPIVAAVRAGATVGEVSDAFRSVFGEHDRQR
jgi:methylmalonyl-CoA mutase N-terminal domain/subunit